MSQVRNRWYGTIGSILSEFIVLKLLEMNAVVEPDPYMYLNRHGVCVPSV